ncbi:hypothetical protein [Flavobacterium kingsejongi]|uniref:Lipoprotein n=1 Tax=Flavobacterium kingsejongi TaxID=1678728 RepID=A0A2S1LQZ5_9FLAO|nr:hypothetical protein [Flavobacterium kingsejongi]AWG26066.1 hypothetical protein FK004_12945 [Flavobacterium kingsejongi]
MIRKIIVPFLVFALMSCSKKSDTLGENSQFDMEQITFKEQPLVLLKNSIDSSFYNFGASPYTPGFEYPKDHLVQPWNGADSHYGYSYFSKEIKGIARCYEWDFDVIGFLVDKKQTLVAVTAYGSFKDRKTFEDMVAYLNLNYGDPTFQDTSEAPAYYEWTLKDRIIQIQYQESDELTLSAGQPDITKSVHQVSLLVFEKSHADAIQKTEMDNFYANRTYKTINGNFSILSHYITYNEKLSEALFYYLGNGKKMPVEQQP